VTNVFSNLIFAIDKALAKEQSASPQNRDFNFSLSSIIHQVLAESEGGTVYKWSNDIDCPGLGNGDYQVCQVNGFQNVCTNPGGRTCNCGSSSNWNKDGNCD
jgi:hypothetical protein